MNRVSGILIGFDFGMKHIGVAIGQTITNTAYTLGELVANQGIPMWVEITQLIAKWRPIALVVGIPLNMDDTYQLLSYSAKAFADELRKRYVMPVYEVDERLTTKSAREKLFSQGGYRALQSQSINGVAAQLILQAWLFDQQEPID